MKRKENIKKIVLVLFSTAFCLFMIEVSLRIFYPQISEHDEMFKDDDLLGWSFIPGKRGAIVYFGEASHYIQINESGFRDGPFEEDRERKKIMVIGDSFVSNVSVKDDEVFTEVLEKNLPGTSVMNFGVNGYGQVQEMLLLEKWIDEVNPDLVILMVYVRNDFADNIGKGQWNRKRPIAVWDDELKSVNLSSLSSDKITAEPEAKSDWKIYRKFHLYHFVSKSLSNMKARHLSKAGSGKVLPYAPPETYLSMKVPPEHTRQMHEVMEHLILRMADKLKNRKIPLLITVAPSIVQVEDDYWNYFLDTYVEDAALYDRSRPNQWFKELEKQYELPVLDLFPVLYQARENEKVLYNPKEQHWTATGNALVARTIENYLKVHFSAALSAQ